MVRAQGLTQGIAQMVGSRGFCFILYSNGVQAAFGSTFSNGVPNGVPKRNAVPFGGTERNGVVLWVAVVLIFPFSLLPDEE